MYLTFILVFSILLPRSNPSGKFEKQDILKFHGTRDALIESKLEKITLLGFSSWVFQSRFENIFKALICFEKKTK
jgi:hypothetical protein